MTSFVFTPYTATASFQVLNQQLKNATQWEGKTPIQTYFLKQILPIAQKDINAIPEIEARCSRNVQEINKFLQDRGFSIHLDEPSPILNLRPLATASILDIIFKWIEEGTPISLRANSRLFEGVSMADKISSYHKTFFICDLKRVLVQFTTTTEDLVYIMIASDPPIKNFDLLTLIQNTMDDIPKLTEKGRYRLYELKFPKIKLAYNQRLVWLEQLSTRVPEPYIIDQALEQTTMKLDEKGGQVKTALAKLTISGGPFPIIINRPFYLWLYRKGLTFPLFIAYLDYDSWCPLGGKQRR
jgi:hypothetical protein